MKPDYVVQMDRVYQFKKNYLVLCFQGPCWLTCLHTVFLRWLVQWIVFNWKFFVKLPLNRVLCHQFVFVLTSRLLGEVMNAVCLAESIFINVFDKYFGAVVTVSSVS